MLYVSCMITLRSNYVMQDRFCTSTWQGGCWEVMLIDINFSRLQWLHGFHDMREIDFIDFDSNCIGRYHFMMWRLASWLSESGDDHDPWCFSSVKVTTLMWIMPRIGYIYVDEHHGKRMVVYRERNRIFELSCGAFELFTREAVLLITGRRAWSIFSSMRIEMWTCITLWIYIQQFGYSSWFVSTTCNLRTSLPKGLICSHRWVSTRRVEFIAIHQSRYHWNIIIADWN